MKKIILSIILIIISSFSYSADRIFVKQDIPLQAGETYVLVGGCVVQFFHPPTTRSIFANTVYEIQSEETVLGAMRLPIGQGYGKIFKINHGNIESINCERLRRDQEMSLFLVENTSDGFLFGVYER